MIRMWTRGALQHTQTPALDCSAIGIGLFIMACLFIRNVRVISGGGEISFHLAFQTKWKLHHMQFSYQIVPFLFPFLFFKGMKHL